MEMFLLLTVIVFLFFLLAKRFFLASIALSFSAYPDTFDVLKNRWMDGNFFEPRSGADATGCTVVVVAEVLRRGGNSAQARVV
jgi:hypothetical protein